MDGLVIAPLSVFRRIGEENRDLRALVIRYQQALAQRTVDLEVAEAEIRSCRQRLAKNYARMRQIL